ncbi:MAG: radical SAM family heme chaperone HemW [Bacteroidia bacterium]
MSGLYLHIPFCKQACHYCDFHFSTSMKQREAVLNAMLLELEMRANYLPDNSLQSIYFGGGTPSVLSELELTRLFDAIEKLFILLPDAEITLEANPDDLSLYQLNMLAESPINRLSIGVQSFRDDDLLLMNRAHSAEEARKCLNLIRDVWHKDLTADLIYGMPAMSDADWVANLDELLAYDLPHFSAYALTVEHRTALHKFVQQGKVLPASDEQQMRHFDLLLDIAASKGYEHYEISNFARPGKRAVHNSSYWLGSAYLGIGPSAHSFDGKAGRQWNISNNALYVKALEQGKIAAEFELLTKADQFNEYLLTRLRTSEGISLHQVVSRFGSKYLQAIEKQLADISAGWYELSANSLRLSKSGKHYADRIASELFILADDEEPTS